MTALNPIRGRTVVFASSKGGVGKTTTCACISVRAAADFPKVAMIDIDSSHGLEDWAKRRSAGKAPGNPRMFTTRQVDQIVDNTMMLKAQGWQWIFIDSPPAPATGFEEAIKAADLVVIPIKASPLDMVAIMATVNACELHGKPFVFVLTMFEKTWKISKEARQALSKIKADSVMSQTIENSQAFVSAMTTGLTGPEYTTTDKRSQATAARLAAAAEAEINAVWAEIMAAVPATTR